MKENCAAIPWSASSYKNSELRRGTHAVQSSSSTASKFTMALASLEGCVFILLGISLAGAIPAGKYLEVEDDVVHVEHPVGRMLLPPPKNLDELLEKGKKDQTTVVDISVMIYYTSVVQKKYGNMSMYFEKQFDSANQAMVNSEIPIRLRMHCMEKIDFPHDFQGSNFLINFRAHFGWDKGGLRKMMRSADVAVVFDDMDGTGDCGMANGINEFRFPYASVDMGCATWTHTFAHEVGHILGANHDRENAHVKGEYNYGWYISPRLKDEDYGYGTIMAYAKLGFLREANQFSSSTVKNRGRPTGDALNDNARMLTETRFGHAAVGDESWECGGD